MDGCIEKENGVTLKLHYASPQKGLLASNNAGTTMQKLQWYHTQKGWKECKIIIGLSHIMCNNSTQQHLPEYACTIHRMFILNTSCSLWSPLHLSDPVIHLPPQASKGIQGEEANLCDVITARSWLGVVSRRSLQKEPLGIIHLEEANHWVTMTWFQKLIFCIITEHWIFAFKVAGPCKNISLIL